jgi:hypothetical protein
MPRNKRYGNNYWNSDGPKVKMREVILYSDLEYDHWIFVETNPLIETYCEQPLEISYVLNGELHTTIFDMWIKYFCGKETFIEVKYSNEIEVNHPRNIRTQRQIQAQKQWCFENGFDHKIVTEKEIRVNHIELENRIKMLSFVRNNDKPKSVAMVLKMVCQKPITLNGLGELIGTTYYETQSACLWLIYKGLIKANISQMILGNKTEVWIDESSKGF